MYIGNCTHIIHTYIYTQIPHFLHQGVAVELSDMTDRIRAELRVRKFAAVLRRDLKLWTYPVDSAWLRVYIAHIIYIYVYVYVYVCMYACIYIFKCIYIHIYTHTYVSLSIYTHIYIYIQAYTCIHIYIYSI